MQYVCVCVFVHAHAMCMCVCRSVYASMFRNGAHTKKMLPFRLPPCPMDRLGLVSCADETKQRRQHAACLLGSTSEQFLKLDSQRKQHSTCTICTGVRLDTKYLLHIHPVS